MLTADLLMQTYFEIRIASEGFLTNRTTERSLSRVNSKVLYQVSLHEALLSTILQNK
jgi:hypothetical protein